MTVVLGAPSIVIIGGTAAAPASASSLYTFGELTNQVLSWLDEAGDTGTTQTNVHNALNQAQQQRLSAENWPFLLWDTPETLTLVPQRRQYALHPAYWRPFYFFNRGTKSYLQEVQQRQLAASGARWNTDQGRALLYMNSGSTPVQAQPTGPVDLAPSTSSADVGTAKDVTITGIVSSGTTGGTVFSEVLTPNSGTVSSTVTYSKLLRVTLRAPWEGTLTLTSNGQTLLILNPGELGRAYPLIELLALPQAPDVIEYRFFRQPLKMLADNDAPEIPPPHSQILVWDALLLFAGYNTDLKQAAILVWKDMQMKMEKAMTEDFLEGRSLESQPRLIRDLEDDWIPGVPRVYSS